ncbi:MAG: HORMA-1 domain-containing protein [Candidatus Tyrphobacter sp.]
MSQTATRSQITTILDQILNVTRSVNSDMIYLADQYPHQLSESQARRYINDFRVFMNYGVLDDIKLCWTDRYSGKVVDALRYTVENGEAVRSNDRAGDLPYDTTVAAANFIVRINRSLEKLTATERAAMERKLWLTWGPVPDLDFSLGRFVADKTYSQTSIALRRERFKRT